MYQINIIIILSEIFQLIFGETNTHTPLEYGMDDGLTVDGLQNLLCQINQTFALDYAITNVDHNNNKACVETKCFNATDLFVKNGFSVDATIHDEDVNQISAAVLFALAERKCTETDYEHLSHDHGEKPSAVEIWSYSLISVTIINLLALMGAVFHPFMKTQIYESILNFMVALAVGTLAASSLLFLIPEALLLTKPGNKVGDRYIWLCLMIFGGIYLFFLMERMLKFLMYSRKNGSPQETGIAIAEANQLTDIAVSSENTQKHSHLSKIKPVGWMIVFGDGLHNFIDGLSIGAAFSESTFTGLSVSLACACEELPHELGDFAVLLASGMSIKQALFYNFLSACSCYLGLIVGISLGHVESSSQWIFALAGGLFLYISLADMFPEMNVAAEKFEKERGQILIPFLVQNAGLLTGAGLMLILAVFGGQIDLS